MSEQLTSQGGDRQECVPQADDEILVAVRAVAPELDEMIRAEPLPEGWFPGWDLAGVVVKAAPEGFSPMPGDRVVGVATSLEWSSTMAVPSDYAVVLPDYVSFEQAAELRVAVLTALRLVRSAGTLSDRRVLVTGADQGIGRLLVELAAALGAEVTALVQDGSRVDEVAELGAAHVFDGFAGIDGGFDVVYEAAFGDVVAAGEGLVAPDGTAFLYESFAAHGADITFFRFFGGPEEAGLRHFVFRVATPADRELAQLLDLLTSGELSLGVQRESVRESVQTA
jgi:NADPH:quinone reductase-like Zn-dependent oxidoreductase